MVEDNDKITLQTKRLEYSMKKKGEGEANLDLHRDMAFVNISNGAEFSGARVCRVTFKP